MSKRKSTVCLVLITIVLAVVCLMSFVSFPVWGTVKDYHSILSNVKLGSELGGSYYTVYYPDGVLSKEDYTAQYDALDETDKAEFADTYVRHGDVYLKYNLSDDDFDARFARAVEVISRRFEALGVAGYSVSVQDDYTVRVELPASVENAETAFEYFSYDGDFSMGNAAGVASLGADRYHPISDYFKSATSSTRNHTPFVRINLTKEGRDQVFSLTNGIIAAGNGSSATVVYFNIGDSSIVSLNLSEPLNDKAVYISGYSSIRDASIIAVLIDSCIKGDTFELAFTSESVYTAAPAYGTHATLFLLIGAGALLLAAAIHAIVRYRGIGAAHLYALATFLFAMILYLAAMPVFFLTASGALAVLASTVLLVTSNYGIFARAKAEFDLGKTITSSVKIAYRKALYPVLERHIVLLVLGLLAALVGVTELQLFGMAFAFGVLLSGVCVLLLTRFYWYLMIVHAKNPFRFCNWKREEVEDDA